MPQGPLSGLRVIDFSRVLAGPHCSKTLRDLGADVIKIEPPRPDISRAAYPQTPGISHYYMQQNSGKRNLSIDLNFAEGREIVRRLIADADIVVENFRAGTLAHFGLDYANVKKLNPRIIYASISGYGQNGPLSHRAAYAPTVQAECGFTHTAIKHLGADLATARHDAYSHADVYTGLEAVIAILAALHKRGQTGLGQHVDVAMAATIMAINERVHADLSGVDMGDEPLALGAALSPFFRVASGELITIATSITSTLSFPLYIAAMRRADLAQDPRFLTAELRLANARALHEIIQRWILTFDSLPALEAQLDEAKLAFGVVRTIDEFAASEWASWWGAVETVDDRVGGQVAIPGKPWRFSDERLDPAGVPAYRGEHNRQVLRELDFPEHVIAMYERQGVLTSAVPGHEEQLA
jgi:crotonobetainyl-CoA:carnitine CoA-transferase CaiB-like acyl-CoA transferase